MMYYNNTTAKQTCATLLLETQLFCLVRLPIVGISIMVQGSSRYIRTARILLQPSTLTLILFLPSPLMHCNCAIPDVIAHTAFHTALNLLEAVRTSATIPPLS